MKKQIIWSLTLLLAAALVTGCGKETETLSLESATDYLPLQTGKYITYQLDSTVFSAGGTQAEVHSYQEKNTVEESFKDGAGRTSYRVSRLIRDAAGSGPWKASATYFITPDSNRVELIENNLRFVKLVSPVRNATTWKGNGFLPDDPYKSYNYVTDINNWNYDYDSVGQTVTINGKTFNNAISLKGIDESVNLPVTAATAFASRSLLMEKYVKGLGLVYQEFILYEYQGTGKYYVGFGVKRSIIDSN